MEQTVVAKDRLRTAASSRSEPADAAADLISQLGDVDAAAVLFFTSSSMSGTPIAERLAVAFPDAAVVGCTTAGEFTERGSRTGSVSAIALPRTVVPRAAAALARMDEGVDAAVNSALAEIERAMGISLREADPNRYIGSWLGHINQTITGVVFGS